MKEDAKRGFCRPISEGKGYTDVPRQESEGRLRREEPDAWTRVTESSSGSHCEAKTKRDFNMLIEQGVPLPFVTVGIVFLNKFLIAGLARLISLLQF